MNFQNAIILLEKDKKVYRTCWEKGHYWQIKHGQLVDSQFSNPHINLKQLVADDWEEYQEEQQMLSTAFDNVIKQFNDFIIFIEKNKKEQEFM